MSDHTLSPSHYKELIKQATADRVFDDAFFVRCNGNVYDSLYVAAIGEKGVGLDGRVCLLAQRVSGETVSLMVTASEARQFAAALLDEADRLDGVTPLAFFPPGSPDATEPVAGLEGADPFASAPCCAQCGNPQDNHTYRHPFRLLKNEENDQ